MSKLPSAICGNGFHFIADGETICACQLARTQELDVSARLQQLEQEKAELVAALKNLYAVVEAGSPRLLEDNIYAERALAAIAKAEGR